MVDLAGYLFNHWENRDVLWNDLFTAPNGIHRWIRIRGVRNHLISTQASGSGLGVARGSMPRFGTQNSLPCIARRSWRRGRCARKLYCLAFTHTNPLVFVAQTAELLILEARHFPLQSVWTVTENGADRVVLAFNDFVILGRSPLSQIKTIKEPQLSLYCG